MMDGVFPMFFSGKLRNAPQRKAEHLLAGYDMPGAGKVG